MAVGETTHPILARLLALLIIEQRVPGRGMRIQRSGQIRRPGQVLGHHHDPTLVGMGVMPLVPIDIVETQRQSSEQDQNEEQPIAPDESPLDRRHTSLPYDRHKMGAIIAFPMNA